MKSKQKICSCQKDTYYTQCNNDQQYKYLFFVDELLNQGKYLQGLNKWWKLNHTVAFDRNKHSITTRHHVITTNNICICIYVDELLNQGKY